MNFKRIKKGIVVVILMMCVMYVDVLVAYANTNEKGIPKGYTPIYDISGLYAIRNNPKGNYILMNDIDLTESTAEGGDWDQGNGWKPIEDFAGVFDGNGNRIIGMHIYGGYEKNYINLGLFGNTKAATIKNLGMIDCDIAFDPPGSQRARIGTIIGSAGVGTTVESCYSSGNIVLNGNGSEGEGCAGGLVGYTDGSDDDSFMLIQNCFNYCRIDASNTYQKQNIGGLVGYVYSCRGFYSREDITRIENCYNCGKIIKSDHWADDTVGLLCGYYNVTARLGIKNAYYMAGEELTAIGNKKDTEYIMVDKLTIAQMKLQQCYTDYDFDNTWEIDPYCSYPYPQIKRNRIVRIKSLIIKTEPSKVVYFQGDKLNLADSAVEIGYEDDIKTTIPISEDMVSGFDMSRIGVQTVTVSYGGMITAFDIEVKEIPIASISIPKVLNLERSKTEQLQATILPENASNKTVTWESGDDNIVTVDENGLITAKAKGKTTITAISNNGLKSECEITVLVPAVAINLDNKEIHLKEGETTQVKAQILPLESTDTISWKSSDENVAIVSDGIIVAKGEGTAIITAFSENGAEKTCTVIVQSIAEPKGAEVTDSKTETVYSVTESDGVIKTVEFKSCNSKVQKVVIPKTITINNIEYKVTAIANNAFKGCSKLKKITIGSNIESIGDGAFVNCKKLTKITIPANVKKIGNNAFKGCNKLKTITIKTVKLNTNSVSKNAFKGVGNKVTIKVPKKMKKAYTKLFRKKGLSKKVKIK